MKRYGDVFTVGSRVQRIISTFKESVIHLDGNYMAKFSFEPCKRHTYKNSVWSFSSNCVRCGHIKPPDRTRFTSNVSMGISLDELSGSLHELIRGAFDISPRAMTGLEATTNTNEDDE
jgi:hypothetical protein